MVQSRQFTKCADVDPVIVCRLCEDSWDNPTELQPCGHIFCEACIRAYEGRCTSSNFISISGDKNKTGVGVLACPTCSRGVEQREHPNRILVNKALAVVVRCGVCEWKGSREQSQKHTCPPPPPPQVKPSTKVEVKSPLHSSDSTQLRSSLSSALRNFDEVGTPPQTYLPEESKTRRRSIPSSSLAAGEKKWEQYGLTQVEYDQIMGVFMHFDTDGSGFLTRSQLRELAFCLNYVNREEDIDRMLSEMGCDESGGLMFHDLCLWLGSHQPDPQALYGLTQFKYTEVLLQFRSYDTENKGVLEWDSFKHLCLKNGYAKNEAEVAELFRSSANNNDKTVNLHQFLLLCQRLWGISENDEGKNQRRTSPLPGSSTSVQSTQAQAYPQALPAGNINITSPIQIQTPLRPQLGFNGMNGNHLDQTLADSVSSSTLSFLRKKKKKECSIM